MEKLNFDRIAYIISLIEKYRKNILNQEELRELNVWRNAHPDNQVVFEKLTGNNHIADALLRTESRNLDIHVRRITKQIKIRGLIQRRRYWVAAAAILMMGIISYFFKEHYSSKRAPAEIAAYKEDVAPGTKGALLTLPNGSTIMLDSTKDGDTITTGTVKIIKQQGRLLHIDSKTGKAIEGDNVLTTPVGRQFELILPDKSKVWLNAASSIKYPSVFTGRERNVEITGEVYFEIAKNKNVPFVVSVGNNKKIEVLGTHFNVNAYSEQQSVKTTLLEGSVKVINTAYKNAAIKITPGQQAQMSNGKNIKVVNNVEVSEIVAWKEGRFVYDAADIRNIMQAVARWYNVKIDYRREPQDKYTISISNKVPLSQLLDYLEKSGGVHFEIKGGTVIVK